MTLRQHCGIEVPKQTISAARQTLTNYRRELAEANTPRGRGQAPAATVADLRRICAALPPNLAGHRDRAIVLLGFAIAARRSNLAALDVTDVVEHAEGLAVTIRYGKTGAREAAVDRGTNPGTCPVRAVRTWIEAAGLSDKSLFRPIDRHGNLSDARMSPRACGEVVTRAAEAAGVPYCTGHSLRAGLATEARKSRPRRENHCRPRRLEPDQRRAVQVPAHRGQVGRQRNQGHRVDPSACAGGRGRPGVAVVSADFRADMA
ncbi:tyrosine-type recombinase/integrase [Nocardia sp. CA-151230]|uniref:tyrosine-type recombinase/integrase n=1 Tax=Nocardia sp. CA-151230 TaxID=3239982 RepID=UPI003D8E0445